MRKLTYLIVLMLLLQTSLFATNWYISASNSGSGNQLKTIDAFNLQSVSSSDSVFLKRGEIFRGSIQEYPRYIGAYGTGAKPIVTGSISLTGWTVYSGTGSKTIWKTTYKSNVGQLFVDTVRQVLARWPNTHTGFAIANPGSTSQVTASGIPAGVAGANIRGRINEWKWDNATVLAQSGNTLDLSGLNGFTDNYGFCIDGVLPLLDTDNEWVSVKNGASYDIYFDPAGAKDPNTLAIEGSVLKYGVGDGNNYGVSNLHVDNVDFRNQLSHGLWLLGQGVTNNKITNCDFSGQVFTTIELFGTNHIIQNCNFKNSLGNAIYLFSSSNVKITNNTFRNIGAVPGFGRQGDYTMIAILSDNGASNYFGYNRFDSIGSGGIYSSGKDVIIEKNIVRYSNVYNNDQGGIYTYGKSTSTVGTIIRNNYVYKTLGSPIASPNHYDAHGIYFDEGTSGVTATNNTIVGPGGNGILNNGGTHNNTMTNNVVYGALLGSIAFAEWQGIDGATVKNNELFSKSTTQSSIRFVATNGSTLSGIGTFSGNYYVNPYVANSGDNIHVMSSSFTTGPNTSNSAWNSAMGDNGKTSFYYGGSDKSELFSNLTDNAKTYTLSCKYKDLDNADITTFTLQPYTSRILINPNYPISCVVSEIEEVVANSMFSLYPNPTEGSINITSKNGKDVTASLYNYTGTSLVKVEGSLEEVNSKINEVFANQKAGLYIIQLNDGTYSSDLKVVKK